MAQAQQADEGRTESILATGDCERAECGPRLHRTAVRGQGDSRTVHEFGAGREHGNEHSAAERTLCGRAGFSAAQTRFEASFSTRTWSRRSGTKRLRNGPSPRALALSSRISWCSHSRSKRRQSCFRTCRPSRAADALAGQIEPIGTLAHLQRAPLVRPRDYRLSITPSCSTARFTGCTTRAACSRGAN